MATRILRTFDELKSNSQTGLITYLTAGFPNQDLCLDIINELSESGSDLIEIGMPFSDPMAEGPIIQQSSKIALDNGLLLNVTNSNVIRLLPPLIISHKEVEILLAKLVFSIKTFFEK